MKTFIFLLSVLLSSHSLAKKNAVLSPFDALAVEGQQVVLKVKAEQDKVFPFRPDIKDALIEYKLGHRVLGRVSTDKDGFAKLKLNVADLGIGLYKIKLKLVANRDFIAKDEVLQLSIWPEDQAIIVTDIDQTISDVENSSVLLRPISQQSPFQGSQEVLKEFKQMGFKIVYLTAREDALFHLTKSWLDYHQFPAGHLIMWDVDLLRRRVPWNHGQYKSAALKNLKERFPHISAGFGDKPHDISAYQENEIDAYLVRSRHNLNVVFPDGTKEFQSWEDVWDILVF